MFADIFIWEQRDGTVKQGYVYGPVKAERVYENLKEAQERGEVKWFKNFCVWGWNLKFGGGLGNLKISDLPKMKRLINSEEDKVDEVYDAELV